MVRFNIECVLSLPQEQFWRIRDSPSFIRFIVEDRLLKSLSVSTPISPKLNDDDERNDDDDGYHRHAKRDEDGWLMRQQKYSPLSVDCPDFIRPIVGDTMFNVSDMQYWNERLRPYHISFNITPTFLTDLSSTRGDLTVEHFPSNRQRKYKLHQQQQHEQNKQQRLKNDRWRDLYDISSSPITSSDSQSSISERHQHNNVDEDEDDKVMGRDDIVSEIDSADGTTTDGDESDGTITTSKQDGNGKEKRNSDEQSQDDLEKDEENFVNECIDFLPSEEKSIHRVVGHTRVRILTVGWFVERAVVHNLRLFYKHYGHTVYRFRCKLYREFADGDLSVPISVVIDRFLEHEQTIREKNEEVENVSNGDEDETEQCENAEKEIMQREQLSCKDQLVVDPLCVAT